EYIDLNLEDENLSLKWIANNILYMDEGYLSKLFSRELGEKFSQYLTRKRMENATEILRQNDYHKIYDVAQKVGLGNNPQYFSQLFKKYTGHSPTDYIKKNTSD
ncbi:MAG TPA: AraC family transcriptional regulator, partial [Clostridia bacterium]|nr:AraC family transcriptional regulator [Clostridia bacterium]